ADQEVPGHPAARAARLRQHLRAQGIRPAPARRRPRQPRERQPRGSAESRARLAEIQLHHLPLVHHARPLLQPQTPRQPAQPGSGSPQWQYEAFWRFQIPEPLQKKWNYPEIKDADKRRIIGLNSAHLYHISSKKPKKFGAIAEDWESKLPADLSTLKTLLEFPHAS